MCWFVIMNDPFRHSKIILPVREDLLTGQIPNQTAEQSNETPACPPATCQQKKKRKLKVFIISVDTLHITNSHVMVKKQSEEDRSEAKKAACQSLWAACG